MTIYSASCCASNDIFYLSQCNVVFEGSSRIATNNGNTCNIIIIIGGASVVYTVDSSVVSPTFFLTTAGIWSIQELRTIG